MFTCTVSRGHRTSQGEAVHLSIPEQCPGDIGLVQERIAVQVYMYNVHCPGDIGLVKERPAVHLYLYSVQGT